MMHVLYGANPEDCRQYNTTQIRKEFLPNSLFKPGEMILAYSHVDRMMEKFASAQAGALLTLLGANAIRSDMSTVDAFAKFGIM